ncbi:MAG: hypothetical protein H0T73_15585 [Ardenticatenales bacterium]|nr:hypothetical protein [Ardenticatenales bacterium]
MLFAYTYVPHQMEKMQEFIDFIFEVWCRAPIGTEFKLDLFDEKPELQAILSQFGFENNAPERGKKFYQEIKGIYELFAELKPPHIEQFKHWYQSNNNIECACSNTGGSQIARYADIQAHYPEINKLLESFFKNLYSADLLGLKALKDAIGELDNHYKVLMKANKFGKCPFCGINDMKGEHHNRREAYDHYLPKGLYPFNSINLRNLAPACHDCNSAYKHTKDLMYNEVGRRKAFYPYSTTAYTIKLTVNLREDTHIDQLEPEHIEVVLHSDGCNEEIEAWREVYGIDERYKAKCCSLDARVWLEEVRMMRDKGTDPLSWLSTIQQVADYAPFANSYFLKTAFLEGYKQVGILDEI